jgi:hypothetical protein
MLHVACRVLEYEKAVLVKVAKSFLQGFCCSGMHDLFM